MIEKIQFGYIHIFEITILIYLFEKFNEFSGNISMKKKLTCDYDTVDKISWEATPFSYTARHNCSSCSSKHKLKEPKWIFWMFHLITEKLTSSNKTISSFSISNGPSKCPIRYTWKSQKMTKGQYVFLATNGSILLWKLFWPTVRKKNILVIEITRTFFSNSERSEQFLVTECFFNLFLEISHI